VDRTGWAVVLAVLNLCVLLPATYNNIPDIRQLLYIRSVSRQSSHLPKTLEKPNPRTTQHALGKCATELQSTALYPANRRSQNPQPTTHSPYTDILDSPFIFYENLQAFWRSRFQCAHWKCKYIPGV
jgi:hypothetical protein